MGKRKKKRKGGIKQFKFKCLDCGKIVTMRKWRATTRRPRCMCGGCLEELTRIFLHNGK